MDKEEEIKTLKTIFFEVYNRKKMIKAIKKIILIIFIMCFVFVSLAGCSEASASKNSRMVFIEDGPGYNIVYDQYTKVMYVMSDGAYNRGTFTLLVNEEGKPLLYEG